MIWIPSLSLIQITSVLEHSKFNWFFRFVFLTNPQVFVVQQLNSSMQHVNTIPSKLILKARAFSWWQIFDNQPVVRHFTMRRQSITAQCRALFAIFCWKPIWRKFSDLEFDQNKNAWPWDCKSLLLVKTVLGLISKLDHLS